MRFWPRFGRLRQIYNWKLISFDTTWLHPKLKNKKTLSLSFSSSLASLYLFEQCLRLGVTSTSSVCLTLRDESLYVFPNCKLLWIKASAKWLNVNVIKMSSWHITWMLNKQIIANYALFLWISFLDTVEKFKRFDRQRSPFKRDTDV